MRKTDQEIKDPAAVEDVVRRASVARLGLCDDGVPYIVPVCFGYEDKTIFVHGALAGRKIDILRKNATVCFECEADTGLVTGEVACLCTMKYRSVIGYGKASLIEDAEGKRAGLDVIMRHYGAEGPFTYLDSVLEQTCIIRIDVESMTGKQAGY